MQDRLFKAVENIVDNIEWEKIYKTMICLDWKWCNSSGLATPSVQQLRNRATSQLEETICHALLHNCDWSISSGGIETSVTFYEDPDTLAGKIPQAELKFVLDSWDYEI